MSRDNQIEEMAKHCHFYDDEVCHLCEELLVSCDRKCDLAILVENLYTAGYRKASEVAREIDDLERYLRLNEDIAIKCKRENGDQNEEYWKGKLAAFKQIRAYIDAELKKKYTEGEKDNVK